MPKEARGYSEKPPRNINNAKRMLFKFVRQEERNSAERARGQKNMFFLRFLAGAVRCIILQKLSFFDFLCAAHAKNIRISEEKRDDEKRAPKKNDVARSLVVNETHNRYP